MTNDNSPPVEDARAEGWDEAVRALAWAMEHGPDPLRYVAEHNPYRAASRAVPSDHTATTDGLVAYWKDRALRMEEALQRGADHTATTERCNCATYGSAQFCSHHTQADYDSQSHTATTEDAAVELLDRLSGAVRHLEGLRDEHWDPAERQRLHGKAEGVKLAIGYAEEARGLLATARPDTTTEWGVTNLHVDGVLYWTTDEHAARTDATREGRRVVRREVTAWTEAGQ